MIKSTEISNILKTIGFKKEQIEYAINKLHTLKSLEELVEEAINIISTKCKNDLKKEEFNKIERKQNA